MALVAQSSAMIRDESGLIAGPSAGRNVELVEVSTVGDRDKSQTLQSLGGFGVFTREQAVRLRQSFGADLCESLHWCVYADLESAIPDGGEHRGSSQSPSGAECQW